MPYLLSPALEVTGSRSQQNIVGMPVQAKDSGTNGLFNVFAHPPKEKKANENILQDSPKSMKYSKNQPLPMPKHISSAPHTLFPNLSYSLLQSMNFIWLN